MTLVAITAAIVGAEIMREDSPYVPYSAEEIAEEAARCVAAGASIIHLHVREADGRPTQRSECFAAAIAAIRARCDAVIQVSTGGAVGMTPDERMGGLSAGPEMASLNCGSINFGDEVFENSFPTMRRIARQIGERGICPELEIYELGHLDNARLLEREGLLKQPLFVQFVLGVRGALGARENVLRFLVGELPEGTHWTVAGIGRHQLAMAELALSLGGHVRVGLEDNLYLERGRLAEGSAPLVERAVALARVHGRTPASPTQVRRWLETRGN